MSAIKKLLNKSTMVRLASGIVLVLLAIISVYIGGDTLFATTLIISLIGVGELYNVYKLQDKALGIAGYITVVVYYWMIYNGQANEWVVADLIISLIVLFFVYVFKHPQYKAEDVAITIFGVIYVAVMLSYIYQVRETTGGAYTVWLIYLSSWGCDTCAYIFGVMFGKHKMAPVLSPKKTIEGAVGGVLGSCLIGFIYACAISDYVKFGIDVRLLFVIVCFGGSIVSMVGDLTASAIKRQQGIKDYGTVIPGHGGILDRFDSVIFTAPLIWVLVSLLH